MHTFPVQTVGGPLGCSAPRRTCSGVGALPFPGFRFLGSSRPQNPRSEELHEPGPDPATILNYDVNVMIGVDEFPLHPRSHRR